MKQLKDFRQNNKDIFGEYDSSIKGYIHKAIKSQFKEGAKKVNKEAIKAGFLDGSNAELGSSFFGINDRKVKAMINSIDKDLKDVKTATLRMSNDVYRSTIYKASQMANSGAKTLNEAIDMATKDFLSRGFNCIEYKDGRRINIADYADMAVRTATKRANLMGEGELRKQIENPLVYVSKHGTSCDKCGKWQGRVYIDDIWSGGKSEDGKYPLLSTAVAGGLYHNRCRHGQSTYFEGINDEPEEVQENEHNHNDEYIQEMQRKKKQYERLAAGSLFSNNIKNYSNKAKDLQNQINNATIDEKNKTDGEINLEYVDITKEMHDTKSNKGTVKKQKFYEDNNKIYQVDGHNVVYKHDERELEVARLLHKTFGGNVKILPNINFPQGIKSPDYLFRGEKTDLKRITSKRAKDCVKTALKNKEKQANNFIVDNTAQSVSDEDIIRQIKEIYNSKGFLWIDKIYLLKDDKFIKVYKRK